jgi:PAS domain S-box-containing protein
MARILVVDDEPALRNYLARVLRGRGYEIALAGDGASALAALAAEAPDLLLLDLTLPDRDGMEILRLLRAGEGISARIPVLLVSGRGFPSDRVKGLRAGGDDFLAKPFDTEELLARIDALLRRTAGTGIPAAGSCLWREYGDLVLDGATRRVWVAGRWTPLTPVEFRLLRNLLEHPGEPRTSRDLMEAVWGNPPGTEGDPALVRWYVGSLRKKIEKDPKEPRRLINLPRRGYALIPEDSADAPSSGEGDLRRRPSTLPAREPLELLSAVASTAQEALFVLDAGGRVILWNAGAEHMFGRSRGEMLGENFPSRFSALGESPLPLPKRPSAPPEEEIRETREADLRRPDGTVLSVELSLSSFFLWGEPYLLGIARDATERRRGEEIRRQGEERIRRTLDAVPLMASYVTFEGDDPRYCYVNRAYESYFRRPHGTMEGKRVEDVVGAEGYGLLRPHLDRVRSGGSATFRYTFSFPEIGRRQMDVRLLPDFDGRDRTRGCYAFLIDATDYRELEEELFFVRFELEQLRRTEGTRRSPGGPFPGPLPMGTSLVRYDAPEPLPES